jgi:hypothetical protein
MRAPHPPLRGTFSRREKASLPLIIDVVMLQSGHPQLRGDGAPLALKVIAGVMRQADALRIEVDVQHLARPGDGHHVGGRDWLVR